MNVKNALKARLKKVKRLCIRLIKGSKANMANKKPVVQKFNSADYWECRYEDGDTSGAGSYGRLAEFKAEVLNKFVKQHNIARVVEWGCGDGNQLSLAQYPRYIGFDVAHKSVEICRNKFKDDRSKSFHWTYGHRADVALVALLVDRIRGGGQNSPFHWMLYIILLKTMYLQII